MARARHSSDFDLPGLRRRRQAAITRWFEAYADSIYGFVLYRVGGDPDRAADVAQDTFVTALARIEDYDPERGEMFPWLTYIARNCVRKVMRNDSRYVDLLEMWNLVDRRLVRALESLDSEPLPSEILEQQELGELVRAALSTLPPRYRKALEQRYFEDSSVRTIATLDGATEGAVKVLLHRARQAFRTAFTTLVDGLEERGAAR